jgi:hypothetical protein
VRRGDESSFEDDSGAGERRRGGSDDGGTFHRARIETQLTMPNGSEYDANAVRYSESA